MEMPRGSRLAGEDCQLGNWLDALSDGVEGNGLRYCLQRCVTLVDPAAPAPFCLDPR